MESKLGITITKNSRIKISQAIILSVKWLDLLDDAVFLNWFYAKAFYKYSEMFQFYSTIDKWDSYLNNRHRNYQRHEQCVEFLELRFPYTIPVVNEKMLGMDLKDLIKDTLSRVVKQVTASIQQLNLPDDDKKNEIQRVMDYFKNNYLAALPPKLNPGKDLKEFLDNFDGSESLIEVLVNGEKLLKEKLNPPDRRNIGKGEYIRNRFLQPNQQRPKSFLIK